jgi:hypothetical protein
MMGMKGIDGDVSADFELGGAPRRGRQGRDSLPPILFSPKTSPSIPIIPIILELSKGRGWRQTALRLSTAEQWLGREYEDP